MTANELNWKQLGMDLRESADAAHRALGGPPSLDSAYQFLLDNPECFIPDDQWPPDMPTEPPEELAEGYYGSL